MEAGERYTRTRDLDGRVGADAGRSPGNAGAAAGPLLQGAHGLSCE